MVCNHFVHSRSFCLYNNFISIYEANVNSQKIAKIFFFYFFSLAFFFSLDASNITDRIARFINDSRFPNCVVKVIEFGGEPNLCIFAGDDIEEDTELRYNYNAPGLSWRNKVSSQ